jgi:hypothetical protein
MFAQSFLQQNLERGAKKLFLLPASQKFGWFAKGGSIQNK